MLKIKFTTAEKKRIEAMNQRIQAHDQNGRIKAYLRELAEDEEKGIFTELNEDGEVIFSPDYQEQLIKSQRALEGEKRLHGVLKRHFGNACATNAMVLIKERQLPWDVLVELTIEVERLVARQESADTILAYLQTSAKADLLVERQLAALHAERVQAEREEEVEKQLRLASQQETATERQLRQEAEQKIAELERQLAAAQNKDRAPLATTQSEIAGPVEENTDVGKSSTSRERQALKREWRDDFLPKREEERVTQLQKRATPGNVSRTDDEEKQQQPEDNPPSPR